MTRRSAQPVGEHDRRPSTAVGRGERAVDGRPGGLVRARRQRRRRLEAPPPEPGADGGRLDQRAHPGAQPGQREHVRHDVVDRADLALVLLPRRGQEAHEPGVVDGLDRRRSRRGRARRSRTGRRPASAARMTSARPGCSNGACSADDSISCSGSCSRWRSAAKTRITDHPLSRWRARAARRGTARGTWRAAACPTTSSAACPAARASRRAAAARRPRACGGGWPRGWRRGRPPACVSATTTTLSLPL